MKLKKYLFILIMTLYMDFIFNAWAYYEYQLSSIINIVLFGIVNSFIIFIFTSVFSNKVNKINSYIICIFMWFWYCLHYIFYKVFVTPFSIALFRQSDQTLKFGKNIVISVLCNIHIVILFLIPLLMLIFFRKRIDFEKIKSRYIFRYIGLFLISLGIYFGNVFISGCDLGSSCSLIFNTNNVSLNIQKLGVPMATYVDIYRSLFGIDEKIMPISNEVVSGVFDLEEEKEYEDNALNIEFSSSFDDISKINEFIKNQEPTKKNQYTGMFKGKNLIFVVAESFSEIAVSEELTPTLYKLVHSGFYFKNFYTSNNLSTIGGEFQALTGLYADNTILSSWRGGLADYPYSLGTMFKNMGYNTYAYHNNSAFYQDRNVYLKKQGFDNYKGCYNGLEDKINCEQWPQSDVEMIDATVDDYLESDKPFITYYMTVSGHFYYKFNENSIAMKNKKLVENLDYSEEVKGYLATQMELDMALSRLIDKLDSASKLDDTVIVLLADHYPYNLSIDKINELSTYDRDSLIEANSNNLIIYNSEMDSVVVDKVGMSIDVIPTLYNLFGINYDSRLFMGKDILSTSEGIAIFKDKSWVTNKGTYYASTSNFVDNGYDESFEYVDTINKIVNNRVAISRMIVQNNYYNKIKVLDD